MSSEYDSKGVNIVGIDIANEKSMSIIPNYMLVGDIKNLKSSNSIIIGSLLAAKLGVYVGDDINITTSDIKTSIIGSYPTSVNLKLVGIYELKTEIDEILTLVSHETAQKLKNLEDNETLSIRLKTNDLFKADQISQKIINTIDLNRYIINTRSKF